jgi:peptidoglycan/xylan/chitin deacetylase (PgdA/CDA1 family)
LIAPGDIVKSLSGKYFARHSVEIPDNMGGRFSITFDDFPSSAINNGLPVLDNYALKGTFFLACSLCGGMSSLGKIAGKEEAARLLAEGHEIGSHTYSHHRPNSQDISTYEKDVLLNHDHLNKMFPGQHITSFSYPYGETSAGKKKITARIYNQCRSIYPGVNGKSYDRAALKANKIYHSAFNREDIDSLIRRAKEEKGWLIFYTHDVQDHCSPFGCTTKELEYVINESLRSGLIGCTLNEFPLPAPSSMPKDPDR